MTSAVAQQQELPATEKLDFKDRPISDHIRAALETYFNKLDGHRPTDLYDMVISEVERPLLETVMRQTRGNQTRASEMLGINRGTLRKKLRLHGLG